MVFLVGFAVVLMLLFDLDVVLLPPFGFELVVLVIAAVGVVLTIAAARDSRSGFGVSPSGALVVVVDESTSFRADLASLDPGSAFVVVDVVPSSSGLPVVVVVVVVDLPDLLESAFITLLNGPDLDSASGSASGLSSTAPGGIVFSGFLGDFVLLPEPLFLCTCRW